MYTDIAKKIKKAATRMLCRKYTFPLHMSKEETYSSLLSFCSEAQKDDEWYLEWYFRVRQEYDKPFLIKSYGEWFYFVAFRHAGKSIEELMKSPPEPPRNYVFWYVGFFRDDTNTLDFYVMEHIPMLIFEGFFMFAALCGLFAGELLVPALLAGISAVLHTIFRLMPCKFALGKMKDALGTEVIEE